MKATLETRMVIWDDDTGDCIEVGLDREGLGLLEIIQLAVGTDRFAPGGIQLDVGVVEEVLAALAEQSEPYEPKESAVTIMRYHFDPLDVIEIGESCEIDDVLEIRQVYDGKIQDRIVVHREVAPLLMEAIARVAETIS